MPEKTPRTEEQGGSLPFLSRYALVLVGAVMAMTLAGWALSAAGIVLPPGAAAILPPIAGALHVGQHWGRTLGVVPGSPVAWRWAFVGGLIYLALQLVLVLPFAASAGPGMFPVLFLLMGGTTLMTVLINRFFLVIGARSGVAQEKRR